MAVCDMVGWRDGMGKVTEASPIGRRLELRSMQHVKVYGFRTVLLNEYAERAKESRS